jgi:hypothetical protein
MRRALALGGVLVFVVAAMSAAGAAASPKRPPSGATDPAVTDATVATTICGPTTTSPRLGAAARRKVMARYRIADARRKRYVVDLLVPAALGGTTAMRNLWPQLRADATTKDTTEELLHMLVCSGQIDLVTAQQAIVADWTTAGTRAQAAADTRRAEVGAYLAAQAEAERQAAFAEYLASLPPPTSAPPLASPPATDGADGGASAPNPRTDCPATFRDKRCYIVGQQMCQGWYAVLTCTVVDQGPGFQDSRWL